MFLRLLLIFCLLWQSLACCCGELLGTGCHVPQDDYLTTAGVLIDQSVPALRPTDGEHPHHDHHCIGADCWFVASKPATSPSPVRDPLPWSHTTRTTRSPITRWGESATRGNPPWAAYDVERRPSAWSLRPTLLRRRPAELFSICMLC